MWSYSASRAAREAHREVEDSMNKYMHSTIMPVGYLTLKKDTIILEVNLKAAQLLDAEKKPISQKPSL